MLNLMIRDIRDIKLKTLSRSDHLALCIHVGESNLILTLERYMVLTFYDSNFSIQKLQYINIIYYIIINIY